MGVESDQLVFDYLSRVGDLAQTALPAAQRMRLVAQLRTDIDRERGSGDSPAAVRRILDRLGPPDEVVGAAAGTAPGVPGPDTGSPFPATAEPPVGYYDRSSGPAVEAAADGRTDWWSVERGGRLRAGDELAGLPGMTGGVTIPFDDEELAEDGPPALRKQPVREAPAPSAVPAEDPAPAAAPRRWLPRPAAARGGKGWGSPFLLLAAALLIAGAVIGSLVPMGIGWLLGYLSRRLTRPQAKFGILGIPGAAAAGMLVWLWGRDVGKWGRPIAEGRLGEAMQDALPATIRLAAAGSALYLLWRSRRSA